MNEFDYIIIGAGASGLLLADAMANDSFFDQKKISSGSFVKIQSGPFTNRSGVVESINEKSIVLLLNKLKVKLLLSDSRLSLVD